MPALVGIAALALAWAASPCAAQETASPIARGRSFGWGVSAIVPLYLGDVREHDGSIVRYLNPGGGVEGRLFYELPGGLGLGVQGGLMVHASENTRALASYRGAAEVRWVIEVGSLELAPIVAFSIGALVAQVDTETVVTGFARLFGGVQWILAPWVALEGGVTLEGAIAAGAFADAIAWISPQIGVTFHE